jgi:hypothetical protein
VVIGINRCPLVFPPLRHGAVLAMVLAPQMERWPSGLRRAPGKRVGVNAPRGFESPSLRHHIMPIKVTGISYTITILNQLFTTATRN